MKAIPKGIAAFLLPCLLAAFSDAKLPPRHKKWLEEEVAYIISPVEREVFSKLTTDRERDLFIEAFWKHRDPTSPTPENEFKTEHYRRLSYANHFFGRQGPKPGWLTDRGRVYIILGEPNDIQRFEGKSDIRASEVWFYQGKTDLGLPPGFNLVFFQEGGVGEYRLYSPAADGPQALLTSYFGDPLDYGAAYKRLYDSEPSLATVSLSLIPGEEGSGIGRPTLASDLLLQNVETAAYRMADEKYARKFLEYKDIVEVEYSANYIDSDSLVKVIRDPSGLDFVHLAIELSRLSVDQLDQKYYTALKLNGRVTTREGAQVHQFERDITVDLDEEKFAAASHQPLNIHDLFPLIPGEYQLSLLIKNEASKEFSSVDQPISIPAGNEPQLSSLLLGYKSARVETADRGLKPFRLGPHQVYCQPNRVFLKTDGLNAAFRVSGLRPEMTDRAELRYEFLRESGIYRTFTKKVTAYPDRPYILEQVPLADFEPAHYDLKVTLLVDGREAFSRSEPFAITPLQAINRPWFLSRVFPPAPAAAYDYTLGVQLLNTGRLAEAIPRLESAHRQVPDSAPFALDLARAYLSSGDHLRVPTLLVPFTEREPAPAFEMFVVLGKAHQAAGEWDKAIAVFEKAISHYGLNVSVLNEIGRSCAEKGDFPGALAAWKKSLEINPEQPQIRKYVEELKGK